ncbi:hypothetical protein [Brevundimonas sp. Leaf280]|uniref:hypothetical protein n=1 Tax=Brevundimonas sp. Leaf280 TaxID=1736320 RepID=UPI0012E0DD43|nr:hypothetical protein [Brevundimonas sp. Leaf280]
MQDADDHEAAVRTRANLCEILEYVNVGVFLSDELEELAHLVDDQRKASTGIGVERLAQPIAERDARAPLRRLPAFCARYGLNNDSFGVGPAADDWHDDPATDAAEGVKEGLANIVAETVEERGGFRVAEEGGEGDGQTRLAATVRTRPGERGMSGLRAVPRHGDERIGGRACRDEAFESLRIVQIRINAN